MKALEDAPVDVGGVLCAVVIERDSSVTPNAYTVYTRYDGIQADPVGGLNSWQALQEASDRRERMVSGNYALPRRRAGRPLGRGRAPRCHLHAMLRLYIRSGPAPAMASGKGKRFAPWGWVCSDPTCGAVRAGK
jgi:hypothetical protein